MAAVLAAGGSIGSTTVRAENLRNPVIITEPNSDGHPFVSSVVQMPAPNVTVVRPEKAAPQVVEAMPRTSEAPVPPSAADIVTLEHPQVVDTATIQAGDTTVNLFGIEGIGGEPADGLQAFLSTSDAPLRCQAQANTDYVCLMADGTDVAQVALANGAARTTDEAPDAYRDQEAAAQAARLGIWSDLPPPPETIKHPIVYDTATLSARGRNFALSGINGFMSPYTGALQGFIASHGDSVTCSAQPEPGQYVCLLPDGTDVAKVALANGLARLGDDAPADYGAAQQEAVINRRGYWRTASDDTLAAASTLPTVQERTPIGADDDGADGVSYPGGVPVATVGAEKVFLMLGAGALGWGFYDHLHHWHQAPADVTAHMEQFHPAGAGLHVYDHVAAVAETHHHESSPPGRSSTAARIMPSEQVIHNSIGVQAGGSVAPRPGGSEVARAAPFVHPAAGASAEGFHPRPPAAPVARPAPVAVRIHPAMNGGGHR